MSSPPPRRSFLTTRMVMWIIGAIAGFAMIYFSLPKQKLGGPAGTTQSDDSLKPSQGSLCEVKLTKWIQSVNPERLQYNTDIESRIQELNRYWTTCGPPGDKPLVTDLKPIEAQLEGDALKRAMSTRFGRRDIEHIRQTLLLSRIAERVSSTASRELDRAVALMALISPQIDLLPAQLSQERPLTPFDCLLIGQGTPADRAWVFAEAMRQLHLDAVVLTTDNGEAQPLLAVTTEEGVILFDALTGWPIPAAGEAQRRTVYRVPAKLNDTLADDSILRQLDLEGRPYPWTAEKLKAANVGMVGTTCTWAPRMAELQFQWPTTQMCVIYDGLGPSTAISKGLTDRVNDTYVPLGFTTERIRVWEYPERQAAQYDSLGAEAAPYMAPLIDIMSGPKTFVEEINPNTNEVTVTVQRSKRDLQQARVQSLLGHRVDAIGSFLTMMRAHRLAPKQGGRIDATVQQAMDQNRVVADKANYWMATTQFEHADYETCLGTLARYAKEFPLGEMREPAIMRQAACLEKTEKHMEAEQVLSNIGPGPNEFKRALYVRRLKELRGETAAAPVSPPAASPEPTEKPAEPPVKSDPPTNSDPGPATPPAAAEAVPPAPPEAEVVP